MVDIRRQRVGAIVHIHGKNINNIVYIEDTNLPFTLIEDLPDKIDDMQWGKLENSQHKHSIGNFNLYEKIEDIKVIKAIEKDLKLSKKTLIRRFEKLARLTSIGDMQNVTLKLVENFINNNDEKTNFNDDILNNNVFDHETTKNFEKSVIDSFKEQLKISGGILKNVNISKNKIKRPNYGKILDIVNGFTFAINYLHGYSAQVIEYSYDYEKNNFDATIEITLADHFGLDFKDIEKYGIAENIIKQNKYLEIIIAGTSFAAIGAIDTAIIANTTKSKDTKNASKVISAGLGSASLILGSLESLIIPAAEGFRAWFILQHYFGCRPFITEMKKTIILKKEQL
jgi:hypothetical protein